MQLKHLGKATPVINVFLHVATKTRTNRAGTHSKRTELTLSHLPRQYAETPVRRKHVVKHPDAQKKRKKDLEV